MDSPRESLNDLDTPSPSDPVKSRAWHEKRLIKRISLRIACAAAGAIVGWFGLRAEGFGLMLILWPMTVVLAINLIAAALVHFRSSPVSLDQALTTMLIFLLPAVAIISYALLNDYEGGDYRPRAAIPINLILLVQAGLVIALSIKAKGSRWITASIGGMLLWVSVSLAFIATMIVTGNFL